MASDLETFLLRMFAIIADIDAYDDIWWRTDGEYAPVSIFINCNDLFYWGCGDSEELTPDNIGLFEQTINDIKALPGNTQMMLICAPLLFCARMRKMRPQKPYYKHFGKELIPLFDACGPERKDA